MKTSLTICVLICTLVLSCSKFDVAPQMLNIHKSSVYLTGQGIAKIAYIDSDGVYHNTSVSSSVSSPIDWRDTREVEYGDTLLYYITVHSSAFSGTIGWSQDGIEMYSKTYNMVSGQTLVFMRIVEPM